MFVCFCVCVLLWFVCLLLLLFFWGGVGGRGLMVVIIAEAVTAVDHKAAVRYFHL